jgi:hypothetical protein
MDAAGIFPPISNHLDSAQIQDQARTSSQQHSSRWRFPEPSVFPGSRTLCLDEKSSPDGANMREFKRKRDVVKPLEIIP